MRLILALCALWLLIAVLASGCGDYSNLGHACTLPCYTGPVQTRGIGSCRDGKPTCNESGTVTGCIGETTPAEEQCNLVDDDCNGRTDDVAVSPISCLQLGACAGSFAECRHGSWACWYPDTVELERETRCDGIDNDCDGRVDEDLLGGSCYSGPVGSERRPCVAGWLKCIDGNPECVDEVLPSPDICNGIDDDCDGAVDENQGEVGSYDIVIILDVSGSMGNERDAVAGALDAYLAQFDGDTRYRWALVVLADPAPYYRRVVNLGPIEAVRDAIARTQLSGGIEPILDALYTACEPQNRMGFDWADGSQHVVMAFGDEALQSVEGTTWADAVGACIASSTLVYTWSLGDFDSLAAPTGGEAFALVDDWTAMLADLNQVLEELCVP